MNVPDLEIAGWEPGTKDHEPVRIVERLGPGVFSPFLVAVPLKQARLIVNAFQILHNLASQLTTPRRIS